MSHVNHTALAAGPEPRRIETALGPVECADTGSGPAMICLHGAMGGWDQSLLLGRALLSGPDRFRILALSRPGYLGTPLSTGATPDQQADAFAALLDGLGIDTAWVAAISGGGPSALAFALNHPDRCRGLIMVSAPTGQHAPPVNTGSRLRTMAFLVRIPGVAALLRRRATRSDPDRTARRAIADPALLQRTLANFEAVAMLAAVRVSIADRLVDRIPGTLSDIAGNADMLPFPFERLTVPVLGVYGDADAVVAHHHGEALLSSPHARLVTLKGGEHFALFTHLEDVRHEVEAFIR